MNETHRHCRAVEAFVEQRLPLQPQRAAPQAPRQACVGGGVPGSGAAGRCLHQTLFPQAKRAFLPGTQEKAGFNKGRCQSQGTHVCKTI